MLKHQAFTLVELLISLSISSVSVLATTGILTTTTTHYYRLEQVSRLQNELNMILEVIASDMQNAGYDKLAAIRLQDPLLPESPFDSSLQISSFGNETGQSCITFRHDINGNGKLDLKSPNELRGYRLRDGAIEVRMGGNHCTESGWQDLSSTEFIIIDSLKFSDNASDDLYLPSRQITIEMSASLAGNTSIARQLSIGVTVSNVQA